MPDRATLAFVTDFCDQAVVLPVFLLVAAVLWAQRRRYTAAAWAVCVAGVLGVMLVLKVADQACGWRVPILSADGLDLVSPSGHAASAAAVWGCGAALLLAGRGRRTVGAALATALAASVLIGVTRVQLGAHTVSEAVSGAVVGIAGATVFGLLVRRREGGATARWPVVAAMLAMGLMHGRHLGAEPTINGVAVRVVRAQAPSCRPPAGSTADSWVERRQHDRP